MSRYKVYLELENSLTLPALDSVTVCGKSKKKISSSSPEPSQAATARQQQKPGNFSNGDLRSNSPLRNILLAGQLLNWSWH